MPFLRGKRKRSEDDILETATDNVKNVVRAWRDESGLGVSVDVARTVGEDFANISLIGVDSVSVAELEAFESVQNVTDFVCDLQNQCIVVRVERRIGARGKSPPAACDFSRLDKCIIAEEAALRQELAAKNWENEDLDRFVRFYASFRSKISVDMLDKRGLSTKLRDAPGACTFFLKGLKFVNRAVLNAFSAPGTEFFGTRVDFTTRSVKVNYYKGKTLL